MALQIRRGLQADLPSSPADGELLYATDTKRLYVGLGGATQDVQLVNQSGMATNGFTGNGSTTAFAISNVITSKNNLLVFIDGVFQQQDAYSIATAGGVTTVTLDSAPSSGQSILIYSIVNAVSGTNLNNDTMTGNGSATTMTLSIAPIHENNTQVYINGVYQPKSTYSVSGTTLTFSSAPANGAVVEAMTMNQSEATIGSNFNLNTMTGDGSDTTLTLSRDPVHENNTQVYIDGVYQPKSTYSVSGTTLTFSSAPPNNSSVEAITTTPTTVNVPADASVTTAKLADSNVTTAKLANSGVTTAKLADSNVTTAKLADSSVTTAKLANSSVTTAKLSGALTTPGNLTVNGILNTTNFKIGGAQGSDGQVLTSTGSGVAWEDASGGSSTFGVSTMTGDGSDTTLTLSANPGSENNTQVYIDGVYQPKSTYSVSGTTLTFSSAPPNNSSVEAIVGASVAAGVPSDASVTTAKLSGALTTPGNLTVNGITDTTNFKVGGAQGTDGQVLTSTGSGVAWEDAGGGGAWNVISSTTLSSAVAYVELTLSGYDSYEIRFSNINDFSMNGTSRYFNAYFSTDGGSNYSSNLRWTKSYTSTRGSSVVFTKSSGAVSALDLIDVYASSSSYQHSLSGVVKLENNISGTSAKHGQYRAIHTREYSSALQPHIKQGEFGITETTPINKIKFIFDTTQSGQSTFNFPVGSKFVVYGLSSS
jgi:hypothetical protein